MGNIAILGHIPFLSMQVFETMVCFGALEPIIIKEDYVHFFSGHDEGVKNGIVIGVFLRAFRVCSEDFFDDEIQQLAGPGSSVGRALDSVW